jgi:hypothetical protein
MSLTEYHGIERGTIDGIVSVTTVWNLSNKHDPVTFCCVVMLG